MHDKEFLNSWKEVAQFVGRSERTIQRWEREWGFPVHRPAGRLRSSVIAVPAEIQKWIERTPLVHSLASLSSLLTLLCIDDDEISLKTRKAFLEDCGYKVLISTESGRAIRLFEENWVDLVILSSAMKSADEDVLARMLKRRNPKIPIVMISGSKEPSRSASMLVEHTVSIASGNAALLSAINQYLPRHQKQVTVPANDVGVAAQPQAATRTKRQQS